MTHIARGVDPCKRVVAVHSRDSGRAWSVEFDGEIIIANSRDPEFDAARVLLARGITGSFTVVDGETRQPRLIVRDIERAATLRTEQGPHGPRFVKLRQTVVERAPAAETTPAGMWIPSKTRFWCL
jgi:hypothetical protein